MREIKEFLGCMIYILMPVIALAIIFGINYLIAVSDLPEWFKFALLS